MPDIAELALLDKTKLQDLLKLRNSSSGFAFQKWFHENCLGDPVNTAKEYASILKAIPKVQSAPIKTIRFLANAAVGIAALPLDPMLGLAATILAGGVDAFLVDRIFRGASPKIFSDRLSDIAKVSLGRRPPGSSPTTIKTKEPHERSARAAPSPMMPISRVSRFSRI